MSSTGDGYSDSDLSGRRRRFVEAKLAATPASKVPARGEGGQMPWEEGGVDGGATRTAAPLEPVAEFYYPTTSSSVESYDLTPDEIDDFLNGGM